MQSPEPGASQGHAAKQTGPDEPEVIRPASQTTGRPHTGFMGAAAVQQLPQGVVDKDLWQTPAYQQGVKDALAHVQAEMMARNGQMFMLGQQQEQHLQAQRLEVQRAAQLHANAVWAAQQQQQQQLQQQQQQQAQTQAQAQQHATQHATQEQPFSSYAQRQQMPQQQALHEQIFQRQALKQRAVQNHALQQQQQQAHAQQQQQQQEHAQQQALQEALRQKALHQQRQQPAVRLSQVVPQQNGPHAGWVSLGRGGGAAPQPVQKPLLSSLQGSRFDGGRVARQALQHPPPAHGQLSSHTLPSAAHWVPATQSHSLADHGTGTLPQRPATGSVLPPALAARVQQVPQQERPAAGAEHFEAPLQHPAVMPTKVRRRLGPCAPLRSLAANTIKGPYDFMSSFVLRVKATRFALYVIYILL